MTAASVTRAWDLTSGRPERIARRATGREVVVVSALDPYASPAILQVNAAGTWHAEIHNLDPRVKIVATLFYRLAAWASAHPAFVPGAPGFGYTVSAVATVVRKDSASGAVHPIGDLPSAYWLHGGTAPDGIEIQSAAAGVRIVVNYDTPDARLLESTDPTGWDLVLGLEAIPDLALGCSGLADEILDALVIHIDPAHTVGPAGALV